MPVDVLVMHNGVKIPALGYGTWQATNEAELETALNVALENGYRHIDTAFSYRNEHVIGRVLKKWFDSGKLRREDVFVTTKLPMEGIHPERVEVFIKKSLEALQLDYVDLYLIHFPIGCNVGPNYSFPPFDQMKLEAPDHVELWKKMEEQVDAGRARTIGLSNFTIKQIDKILKSARIKPHNLQIEVHVFLQQKALVEFCQKNDIVVVAYSPLANPSYNNFLKSFGQPPKDIPNGLQNPVIKEIALKHGKSSGQVMLRYLVERKIIPIPKSVTPARVKENLDIFNFSLDAEDMKKLEGLDLGEKGRVCDWGLLRNVTDHPEYPFGK